ncbi:phosphatase PAP2 family protein [Zavarzinia compransoris]|uniref:Phosphatidic acid phosphatase type 2/haloperoxidase domain-containing protein n=1 Tax=Zavarzinia compransoris TaxID=1264899 RepID=A0A317DTP8_9PROT|nr:phosphatase PAP2 family protein [Zavarzinia compransoris]PWR18031.1 hypothetical protein DKG75_21065 [Zavarzinia compransoris]TDP43502.1 PAP2 superfamily protein [Zavarzinia compransoris]
MTGRPALPAVLWALAQDTLVETVRALRRHPVAYGGLAVAVALLILFVDRPLALWLHGVPADERWFFRSINEVGRSGWMFGAAGLCLAVALVGGWRLWAVRAGFVIGAVLMGGWVVNVLKLAFARARPRLLVKDGTFDFHFFEISPDWNSFPSGHSQAIAGFGAALACIWPRFAWVFLGLAVLPAVARMVMLNHYAADVVAGYATGLTVTYALARACAARGIGPIKQGENR